MTNFHLEEGRRCEEIVEVVCTSRGYSVTRPESLTAQFDLLVNGLRVQVKKRSTVKRRDRAGGEKQIQLRSSAKGFSYGPNEVDVFVVMLDGAWFVFPSTSVQRMDGCIRNNINPGELEPFRDAWHVLSGMSIHCERQLFFKELIDGR